MQFIFGDISRRINALFSNIFNTRWIVAILFITYFIPYRYAIPNKVYIIWKMIMLMIGFISIVALVVEKKTDITWCFFALFFVSYYLLSSAAAGSDGTLSSIISSFIRGLGFISLCQLSYSYNKETFLVGFATGGTIMIIVHLLTVLLFFNTVGGMRSGYVAEQFGAQYATDQHWYLLTYDNETIFYILPIVIALIIIGIKISKAGYFVAAIIGIPTLLSYIIQRSVTAEIASVIFCFGILVLIIMKKNNKMIRLNFKALWILGLILSVVLVFGVVSGLFGQIGILLGKDPTFSNRLTIWTRAISAIMNKPIFGHGVELATTTYSTIWQTHCHNIVLEILYTGGIVSFIAYIASILSLRMVPLGSRGSLSQNIVSLGLICLLISSCLDWSLYVPIPFVLIYIYKFCEMHEDTVRH